MAAEAAFSSTQHQMSYDPNSGYHSMPNMDMNMNPEETRLWDMDLEVNMDMDMEAEELEREREQERARQRLRQEAFQARVQATAAGIWQRGEGQRK